MTKYEETWSMSRRRRFSGIFMAILVWVMGVSAFLWTLVNLAGCAATDSAVRTGEIREPAMFSGLVQIRQMGRDCSSDEEALRADIRGYFRENGLPEPKIVKLEPLSGSSYCGFSQGVADPFGMPESGANSLARTNTSLYWSDLTERELARAREVFSWLKAEPLPSK